MRIGIALGSNLGDRVENLLIARQSILEIPGVFTPCLSSKLYETEPVDSAPGSASFLNAVIEVECPAGPLFLLPELQAIEERTGRPRDHGRNTPRTLDLDILYAGDLRLHEPDLEVPHPRLHLRRFVLLPLHDIQPQLRLPRFQRTVAELLENLNDPAQARLFPIQWE
jgi:2-amino-4-hydroxy-6-hydroxymethyldihydropteridine diphosphokinase